MKLLLLDNYDSFTFNLFHLLAAIAGQEPLVLANDQATLEEVAGLGLDGVVLSPGPGRPERERDFGICRQVVLELDLPLLGVCLGHQGLAHCHGGRIVPAPEPVHGRLSPVRHHGGALFAGIPQGFAAVRYHSLMVAPQLPACLERTAWTPDGIIMGLGHRQRPQWGVQFHPESIATQYGEPLLRNFCELAYRHRRPRPPVCGGMRGGTHPVGGRLRGEPHPVHCRKLSFYPDPEAAFVELFSAAELAFWLDSSLVVPGSARFSFMGSADTALQYRVRDRELHLLTAGQTERRQGLFFDLLEEFCAAHPSLAPELPFSFTGGLVGYLGYELKAECQGRAAHDSPHPDAALLLAERFLAFDHQEGCVYLLSTLPPAATEAWFSDTEKRLRQLGPLPPLDLAGCDQPPLFRLRRPRRAYLKDIEACLQAIRAGESYEICLTNQLCAPPVPRPLDLYRVLRRLNPAPHAAFVRFGELAMLSSSPELFLRVTPDGQVCARPIKGTLARRADPQELARSEKDRAENLMIVDLLRNDLGRVCRVGSVQAPGLMEVETYAHCHQLVSTIRGQLRPGLTAIDCIRAAFPGGSMTGAPKLRTMELIDQLEGAPRGPYSGALGFIGFDGAAHLSIVIRTAVSTPAGISIGAGGAIVALSDPEAEFAELLVKAEPLLRALAIVQNRPYRLR